MMLLQRLGRCIKTLSTREADSLENLGQTEMEHDENVARGVTNCRKRCGLPVLFPLKSVGET